MATKISTNDKALAFRVIQRGHNLQPDSEEIRNLLKQLKNEVRTSHPELMKISSFNQDKTTSARLRKHLAFVKESASERWQLLPQRIRKPFFIMLVLPWLSFSLYQLFWATPRFESQSQVVIKQPDGSATLDPAMALLSGFGVSNSSSDIQLAVAYMHSSDMLDYLDRALNLREHYADGSVDFFSRLLSSSDREDYIAFFRSHSTVSVDEVSSIIDLRTQAFDPEFAQQLNQAMVSRAEWYINSIGHQLAESQLEFARNEHQLVEAKLQDAKSELLKFQQQYNLLDPTAEGVAIQQITYTIESQISTKKAELRALRSVMSESAPEVITAKAELEALEQQLTMERQRLSKNKHSDEPDSLSVGEVMARYSELKVAMELALQAYSSSLISLEKSRIEAYRQLQYLITVESPTLPESHSYPEAAYNISLFAVVGLLLFGIFRIVLATIQELA